MDQESNTEYGDKVLFYKGYPVFGKQTMPSFTRVQKEYKENEACFVFVNRGKFSVRSQEDLFEVDHGHGLLAKCLNYFFETNEAQREQNKVVEAIGIVLFPSLVKELFEFDFARSNYELDFNLKQVVVDQLLDNFRNSIDLLIENPELADESMIRTKLKEFVLLMAKSHNAPSELDFLAGLFRPANVDFKSTIANNLYANLSIDELAALTHMSTSSFKRKFSELFSSTPAKYLVTKKIDKAAELLKSKDFRISEIAYEVGFDSLSSFNRNFQNLRGISPSNYRAELK